MPPSAGSSLDQAIAVTSQWASCNLKSTATHLFIRRVVQAHINDNTGWYFYWFYLITKHSFENLFHYNLISQLHYAILCNSLAMSAQLSTDANQYSTGFAEAQYMFIKYTWWFLQAICGLLYFLVIWHGPIHSHPLESMQLERLHRSPMPIKQTWVPLYTTTSLISKIMPGVIYIYGHLHRYYKDVINEYFRYIICRQVYVSSI